jgi:hypothetical protein
MSRDKEIDELRNLLISGSSEALSKRFYAEAHLYDALLQNDVAKKRLQVLEEAVSVLKRSLP